MSNFYFNLNKNMLQCCSSLSTSFGYSTRLCLNEIYYSWIQEQLTLHIGLTDTAAQTTSTSVAVEKNSDWFSFSALLQGCDWQGAPEKQHAAFEMQMTDTFCVLAGADMFLMKQSFGCVFVHRTGKDVELQCTWGLESIQILDLSGLIRYFFFCWWWSSWV